MNNFYEDATKSKEAIDNAIKKAKENLHGAKEIQNKDDQSITNTPKEEQQKNEISPVEQLHEATEVWEDTAELTQQCTKNVADIIHDRQDDQVIKIVNDNFERNNRGRR